VNSQLSELVKRLGAKEAPLVASYYLSHGRSDYIRAKHPTSLLLRDAEGLRTEWATGRKVTDTLARQEDRRQANAQVWDAVIKKLCGDEDEAR
jgi:hypothetical protein